MMSIDLHARSLYACILDQEGKTLVHRKLPRARVEVIRFAGGPAAILAQNPQSQPAKTKRSPAPAVHAATRAVRRELRNAYFEFVAAYRNAAEKLRAGNRNQPFPTGCLPPALPFVGG